ncbi:MAG: glycoside hydrolase family 172 protein [Bacillota bacterium]
MRTMDELTMLRGFETRSVSPENRTGDKGMGGRTPLEGGTAKLAARDLGTGWKVNPYLHIAPGETLELANIKGPGAVTHIWLTPTGVWRNQIIRFYWDGSAVPSVECPLGDFFASGWGRYAPLNSMAVCVNPGSAFNCYWTMPFRKTCRVTLENRDDSQVTVYYQITYILRPVGEEEGYFHAQFRRVNPLPYKTDYTILDGVTGKGQYVGTYMAWGTNNCGWWGEGEIKFFLDGDKEYPTICGTGTEDYFCGSYDFENQVTHEYEEFSTAYSGLPQVIRPNRLYDSQMRFGMYRWHTTDPIYFQKDVRVTIQALGWRSERRYLPLQDDIASVAYWYQEKPGTAFPTLPGKDYLEII